MSGHTKGEWKFHQFYGSPEDIAKGRELGFEPIPALGNNGERFVVSDDVRICFVDAQTKFKRGTGHVGECPERDANARLIAAAPDLLAASKLMIAVYDQRISGHQVERAIESVRAAIAKATGDA